MSDKFCFPVELREGSKEALFQSAVREDYYCINYEVTKLDEIELRLESVIRAKSLIKAELFTKDFNLISSQMRVEHGKQVYFKFCVNTIKRQYECSMDKDTADELNFMFIITVIPYLDTTDCVTIPIHKEEVLNINDEQIRDLSEDLLVGLSMDMRDLLIHGDFSDAVITNGNHAINVHTAILSARSAVFRNLLKNSSNKKVITISDASAEALKDMTDFMYSGLIKFRNFDTATELYSLADEYELEDLRDACSMYMSNCTTDRVLQTLILAVKYNDDKLKKHAVSFILKNLSEVKATEKWKSFAKGNMDLISEICNSIRGPMEKDALCGLMSRLSAKNII